MTDRPDDVDTVLEAAFRQELAEDPDPELTASVLHRIQRRDRLRALALGLVALAAAAVLLPAAESLYMLMAALCERLLDASWSTTHLAALAIGALGLAWLLVEEPI